MPTILVEFLAIFADSFNAFWLTIPEPLRGLLIKLMEPVLTPLAWAITGAMVCLAIIRHLRRHGSGTSDDIHFDPLAGLIQPRDRRTPLLLAIFYRLTGTDPIILSEMHYHIRLRRTVMSCLLLMATLWALIGSSFFLRLIFTDLTVAASLLAASPYAIGVYLIDLSIINSRNAKWSAVTIRVVVSLLIGILVATPIALRFFASEIHERQMSAVDTSTLKTNNGSIVKEEQAAKTKLITRRDSITARREKLHEEAYNADQAAKEADGLATQEALGAVVIGTRLAVQTSGISKCKDRCEAFMARARSERERQKVAQEEAALLRPEVEQLEIAITATERRIQEAINDLRKSKTTNVLQREEILRHIMFQEPWGKGFLANVITLVLIAIDLMVLLGKGVISCEPYYKREDTLDEVAASGENDFKTRVTPRPRQDHRTRGTRDEDFAPSGALPLSVPAE